MDWRKKRGARGLLGHLHGYGCRINCIETEEELIALACVVFSVENIGGLDQVEAEITFQKATNRNATRRRAYQNIDQLWNTISPFWIETEYLLRQRG